MTLGTTHDLDNFKTHDSMGLTCHAAISARNRYDDMMCTVYPYIHNVDLYISPPSFIKFEEKLPTPVIKFITRTLSRFLTQGLMELCISLKKSPKLEK